MTYQKINDFEDRAIERLIEQHKGKEKVEALIKNLASEVQALENTLDDFSKDRQLSTAVGANLEAIAADLGITRNGDTDNKLRRRCYAAIALYWSSGRVEQVISFLKLAGGAVKIEIEEVFPAKINCVILTAEILDVTFRDDILKVLAAGVGLGVVIVANPNYFGFLEDPDANGFGSLYDSSVGGYFGYFI